MNEPSKCPRCGQEIEIRRTGTIKAHRDNLVGGPCPTAGMTQPEARSWVGRAREEIRRLVA